MPNVLSLTHIARENTHTKASCSIHCKASNATIVVRLYIYNNNNNQGRHVSGQPLPIHDRYFHMNLDAEACSGERNEPCYVRNLVSSTLYVVKLITQ